MEITYLLASLMIAIETQICLPRKIRMSIMTSTNSVAKIPAEKEIKCVILAKLKRRKIITKPF